MIILRRAIALRSILAVAVLAGCASIATPEGAGGHVDDDTITSQIKAAIFAEPTLKSAAINVETFQGAVQLTGFVVTEASARTVVKMAQNVKGVSSVRNDMRIR